MKKYRHAVSVLVLKPAEVRFPDGSRDIDHILLVKKPRRMDVWQLPQGGVEEGETPQRAALRELKEETGLELAGTPRMSPSTYRYDFPPEFVEKFHPVNDGQTLCFVVTRAPKDAVVTVDGVEVDGHVWVLPADLPTYVKRPEYLKIIREVLAEAG